MGQEKVTVNYSSMVPDTGTHLEFLPDTPKINGDLKMQDEINPFLSKLLSFLVFITATERKVKQLVSPEHLMYVSIPTALANQLLSGGQC